MDQISKAALYFRPEVAEVGRPVPRGGGPGGKHGELSLCLWGAPVGEGGQVRLCGKVGHLSLHCTLGELISVTRITSDERWGLGYEQGTNCQLVGGEITVSVAKTL